MTNKKILTDIGALYLNGDADSATDSPNTVAFATAMTMTSATALTLSAKTGSITAAGTLTLLARNGISIQDTFTASSGALVINSDSNSDDPTVPMDESFCSPDDSPASTARVSLRCR